MSEIKVLSKDLIPIFIDLLNKGKSVEFKVSGNSMLPFFKHQQTIVTLNTKPTYQKYDVILYLKNHRYTLHRIVKIKHDHLIVYGDALKTKEIISFKDVLGYVECHIRNNEKIHYKNKWYLFKVHIWNILKPMRKILLKLMKKVNII